MIYFEMPIEALKNLKSNDYPDKTIKELSIEDYGNRKFVFEGLYTQIRDEGIKKPLRVVNNTLMDGHHRALIAIDLELKSVPVVYEGHLRYKTVI